MSEKTRKLNLKIKLTEETSEKLHALSNVPPISADITSKSNDDPPEESPPNEAEADEKRTDDDEELQEKDDKPPQIDYSNYMHYEGDVAIYTDPSTNKQYVWCNTGNQWIDRPQDTEAEKDNLESRYSFENGKRIYTDPDGSSFIWDEEKNAWFPRIDDNFMAYYQMSYGFVDNATKTEDAEDSDKKKEEVAAPAKKKPEEPKWFDVDDAQNTKVYVSNLPLDTTEEEFLEMMQKCGLVMKDPISHKFKIKLYTKPNSQQLKGDGLCTYIKVESVELALKILDGYTIRNHRINVQRAKFQMKGDFNPALKPKKKKRKEKEKLKKIQERLFDWRPEKMLGERAKHERVVIVKNAFDPKIFDSDVSLILEYQKDLREECSKCGDVKKVVVYDRHPEGVAQVIMKEAEDADNVVKLINGRWFGKRQLSAEIWDGKTKYKIEETDSDLNKRIEDWNKFLEEDEDKMSVENNQV